MAIANRKFRTSMLLSTAMVAAFAVPGVAHAQLVTSGDLVDAVDSGGNGGRLTVVDTSATQTDITVLSSVVVANWNRFNVTTGTTVNIAPDAGLTQATLVNRVIGAAPSDISGTINAQNVNLWLINQNGILFGDGATVNSASFFASTIDVANQDIFDFYEGTDLFGNGADTLNFSGSLGSAVATSSPTVTFVTDGSMMFVSEQLNLDASFDAGSGRVSFVTAADVDVLFTPGSPLTYVVNAGTTVAQGQTIAGAVEGAGVEFAMFTAAGVVNAVLQVDATVTANAAVATDNGVRLFAEQSGAGTVTVELSEAITSTGAVDFQTDGDFTAAAAITGSSINLFTGGSATFDDLTATAGSITVTANALSGGLLSATDDVVFNGIGSFLATGVTADSDDDDSGDALIGNFGNPAVLTISGTTSGAAVSMRGGVINVGDVSARSVALSASDSLSIADATSTAGDVVLSSFNGDLSAGDVTVAGGSASLSAVGNVLAGNVSVSGGNVTLSGLGNMTTTSIGASGAIDVRSASGGTLDLGDLSAGMGIALDTTGSITTGTIAALGALTVGGMNEPNAVTFGGNASAASITVDTSGAFGAQGVSATAGGVDIGADSITAGAVSATGGDVDLVAVGNITTASIAATAAGMAGGAIDVDSTGGGTLDLGALTGSGAANLDTTGTLTLGTVNVGGALVIGALNDPATLNLNGNITAGSFAYTTLNPFVSQNITTTNGNLNIDAASIATGALAAQNGGGVILTASGNITTTSIASNEPGVVNGFIDVQSTGGGTLDLGALSSDGNIDLDTSGLVTASTIGTLGDLTIGGTTTPTTVTFTGNVSADAIDIDATGLVTGQNVTATQGDLNILANAISAGGVTATEGDVILSAAGNITTTSISSNEAFGSGGAIDVDSTGGGTLDLGAVTGSGAANLDTTGTLTLGTVNVGGALVIGATNQPTTLNLNGNITAGSFAFTTANPFVSQNITTTNGDLNIDAASIATGALAAQNGGGVILTATGNITTTSIASNEPGVINGFIDVESTGGGTLDLGALSSDGNIDLDTSGLVTASTISTLGDLTIGGTTTPTTVTFTGNVSADAINIGASGTVTALNIASTDGDLNILADTISAGGVTSTGGDVILSATNNITTASITSNEAFGSGGAIDVDSTGGGTLDLGNLNAGSGITLDTTGSITAGMIDAGGALAVGGTEVPVAVTFTGNASAASITVDTTGAFAAQGLTATAGGIDIGADAITAGAVSTTGGDVVLLALNGITTTSIGASGAIDIDSTGGGTLDLGNLNAGSGITLDTTGSITAGSIDAGGALTVGATAEPSSVTFTGDIDAGSVTIDALGALVAQNITATGAIDIDVGGTITTGDLEADLITLLAVGGLTTGNILTNQSLALGTSGANLQVGNVTVRNAGASLSLSANGAGANVIAGELRTNNGNILATAGNAITVGVVATTLVGSSTAGTIGLHAGQNVTTGALTAGEDLLVVTDGNFSAGAITVGDDVLIGALGSVTTGDILANGLGSDASLPTFSGAAGASTLSFAAETLTGSNVAITAGGALSSGTVTAQDNVTLDAASIATQALAAVDGSVDLSALGGITTASVGAGVAITAESTSGGALNLGQLDAGAGVTLDTTGSLTTTAITAGGSLLIGDTRAPSTVSFTGNVSALDIGIVTAGALTALDLVSTGGLITIDAVSINANAIEANGGGVFLLTTGGITTAAITADDGIVAESTGGGALDLGTLNAGLVALDTTGGITTSAITAGDSLLVGGTRAPSTVNFTGNVSAQDISIVAAGALTALDLVSTGGLIDIDAASISANAIEANGGGVSLLTTGGITTVAITADDGIVVESTGGGALNLGTLDGGQGVALDTTGGITTSAITAVGDLVVGGLRKPGVVAFTGDVVAGSITVDANLGFDALDLTTTSGAIDVDALSVNAAVLTSVGGDVVLLASDGVTTSAITSSGLIDVDSTNGGALDLGTLDAGLGVALDTTGSITAAAITAGGALQVGQTSAPNAVTFLDDVSAQSITIDTTGALEALNLASTNGTIDIGAGSIEADAILATGGGAILLTTTFVNTGSISATGMIDVDSTNGGNLNLGTLSAGSSIALDTVGTVTTAGITAGGALVVGALREPGTVTFTGNASASSITVDAGGAFSAQNLTSTAGAINIDAGTITALALSATGGGATLRAVNGVQTSSITATGAIDADSTAGGVLNLGPLGSGAGITLDTTGNITVAAVTAGGDLVVGGVSEPGMVAFTDNVSARSITVDVGGAFTARNLTSTAGTIDIDAGTITALALSVTGGGATLRANGAISTTSITATGAIDADSTAGGALDLGPLGSGAGITLDTTGNITVAAVTAGGALVVGGTAEPGTVAFTGDASAGSITVDVGGAFTAQNLMTTGGIIDIDARTIAADAVAATGGNVRLLSVGNITTGAITATRVGGAGGAIDIDSTGTGEAAGTLNLAALLADLGISLDTQGAIMTGSLTARSGAVAANGRTINSGAIAATGGDVLLQASGAITTGTVSTSRAGGVGGAIDVDSTAGGSVSLGAMTATQGIAIDTTGNVTTVAITAGGDLTVGTAVRASTVTFNDAVQAANITVDAIDLVTAQALRAGTGTIDIEAGDLALAAGPVEAGNVTLTSFNNGSVGLGTETGDFSLTDTELGLIQADSLLINAGTSRVGIADVTFGANAGRNTVAIATTGEINMTGNITGTAGARTFRFGGTAAGTGRASRITSDINRVNVNLGTNALELRGDAIVFGQTELETATRDLSIAELVRDFISNPNSILYDPRTAITNPVYLTAGSLTVTYGGSALFQNTATRTAGNIFSGVVLAGGNSAVPTLTLNPDAPGGGGSAMATNAFALFGSINGFDGSAAALLGESVIGVNGDVLLDASRINGCVIGSGADCVTTIVGNVVMTVPREVISLLVAEDRLLVPFDPLVGTNNESLFSDAANASADNEECENRDANGVCVSN